MGGGGDALGFGLGEDQISGNDADGGVGVRGQIDCAQSELGLHGAVHARHFCWPAETAEFPVLLAWSGPEVWRVADGGAA